MMERRGYFQLIHVIEVSSLFQSSLYKLHDPWVVNRRRWMIKCKAERGYFDLIGGRKFLVSKFPPQTT
jgi:hypothetical protein